MAAILMSVLIWSLTVLFFGAGLIGVLLPLVPGTTLIFAGVVIHKLLAPASLSWATVGWLAVFWALSLLFDFAGVLIGTRLAGGSKWGMTGAGGGAVIGAFISVPALILGTMLGAVIAEKLAHQRDLRRTLLAGVGAGLGFVLGFVGRLACALVIIAGFLLATVRF